MKRLQLIGIVFAILAAPLVSGQVDAKRTPGQLKAIYAAHQSDFDYLLGDWEFTSGNRQYPKFGGRWSAVRLDTGQILDEYRVLGDQGETYYVTTTIRSYNAVADRWELVGMEAANGLQSFGTGTRNGSEVNIEQKFNPDGPKPTILKIRYYDIQPDRFSWVADQSINGGKTWEKNFQRIEAHRIGPARSMGPLTPVKKP